ncbi:MAG: hypothetical protein LBG80_07505 [Bacteroidales bacterium]|nr:hypothetical protein [Bacteroidales bacterium]
MNKMIYNKKCLLAVFLLVVFCGYMVSITCFTHSHIVNGQLVTHSHPYKGTPYNPEHTHTATQLISIALLSYFVTLGATFVGFVHIFSCRIITLKIFQTFFDKQPQIRPYALRAPPL